MSTGDDILAGLGIAGAVGAVPAARAIKNKLGNVGKTPGRAHFIELDEDGNDLDEAGDVNDLPDCA